MASRKYPKTALFAFILVLSLILPVITYSQSSQSSFYTDFFVTVKDINSGELVISMPVNIIWYNTKSQGTINLTKYIDKRGTFSYKISPGEWRLQIYVDNMSTPEIDYFGESTYQITDDLVTRGEVMYIVPVGSLELKVTDPNGNLVSGADVNFKCKSYRTSAKTDKFGSYKADNLPAGECKIYAASDNLVGSDSAEVIQGKTISKDISLSESVTTASLKKYYYIIVPLVILVFLALAYLLLRKRIKTQVRQELKEKIKRRFVGKKKEQSEAKAGKAEKSSKAGEKEVAEKQENGKGELNPRARDIMKTLNDKEQKVANFLIQSGNKSTQAAIRNETGVPKTTLVRVFQALEAKKVIKIETIGKLKKIELTDWFLGKE